MPSAADPRGAQPGLEPLIDKFWIADLVDNKDVTDIVYVVIGIAALVSIPTLLRRKLAAQLPRRADAHGELSFRPRGDADVIDITAEVQGVVSAAPSAEGVATAFVRGSTAAISTMEFEPGGVADLRALLDRLIPPEGDYEHNRLNHDTNSHAHQRATLIGPSEQVPVIDGRLALGTWQQLVLIDFDDRPRERTVIVQVSS